MSTDASVNPHPVCRRLSPGPRATLALFACLLGGTASADAVEWDWEPRCCAIERDLADGLLITLTAVGPPIGHLQVVTPNGVRVGMDEKTRYVYPPQDGKEGGLYVLGPLPQRAIDAPNYLDDQSRTLIVYPQWDKKGFGPIFRHYMPQHLPPDRRLWRLLPGRHTVKVIGEFSGRYVLRFDIDGLSGSRPEVVVAGPDARGVPIQAGDIHVYEFEGGIALYPDPADAQPLQVKRVR